jgi:cellulose synthase/poly-beta-1,6-N-acetylglucosamine synthase-like glycosyltransferase
MTAAPRVSVVVPTYRRPVLLARCLAALAEQDLPPAAYEVIVADDEPSAATRRLCEAWAAAPRRLRLRYLPVTGRHGPAAARNAGWRTAAADVVAFTDDDCVPAPRWLRSGLAAFTEGVVGVQGRVVVPVPARPTDYERNTGRLAEAEFVTANCFYRKDALAAVGGFDERFTMAWREDADLFFTLLERGARLARAPGAVVVHPVRPARWGACLGEHRKVVFDALLYRKHRALYRARIQAGPPWGYYATAGALLAAGGAAMAGRRRLALGALAAWAVSTARFAATRLVGTSRAPAHVAEMIVTSAVIPPLAVFWRLRGAVRYRVLFL